VFGGICETRVLQQLIDEVDTDHDNQISFIEFKAMMKKFRTGYKTLRYKCNTE